MRAICALVLALGLIVSAPVRSAPLELAKLTTDDMLLVYVDPFYTYLVPHTVRNFHNSIEFQKNIYGWKPWEDTSVLLVDLSDYSNAGASVSPFNALMVHIAPGSRTLETTPSSERMFMLKNHELTHVANMDAWNSKDAKWRRIFMGKPRPTNKHPETILYNYLTTPRMNLPRWYMEGAAVFMETWMSGGIGRAQGAYDEMVFRSMVRDGAEFYSNLGIVSKGSSVDFQTGVNAYLYGTRFISYMAFSRSPEQVVEWLARDEDSEAYYSRHFAKVFGLELDDAWNQWIDWEHEFQNANLERVRAQPLTPVERLTDSALGSISRSYLDLENRTMIGAFRYPGVVAHVGVLSMEEGTHERVADIKGPMKYRVTSSAWDPATRTFFYTSDNINWRDLKAVDIDTGKDRLLIKDARIGDIVFNANDQSVWGLRHLNGYVTLVRIPPPYDKFSQVFTWPYGEVPYEMDISPDGTMLSASMAQVNGDQHLMVFRIDDLLEGRAEHIASYDFTPSVPEGFVFSPDGRYLYGSSFITGVSNIIRFDIAASDAVAVSNAESGLFRPIPLDDGRLLVFEYTGQGFIPALMRPEPLDQVSSIAFLGNEIAKKHPVVREWNVAESLRDFDADDLVRERGAYVPHKELKLTGAYPVIEGYRDEMALGYHVGWSDRLQLHSFEMTGSYSWNTPSDESFHFNAEYHAWDWWFRYWHNDADFYDLFGPTERARKGDAFFVGYDKSLIYDDPKRLDFYAEAAYYTGLDTLPDNQNRPIFLIEDIFTGKAGLEFTHTRRSLGAVDHEKGWRWRAEARVDDTDFDTIPKLNGGLDFGFALPWKHSSLWLYSHAGWADGDRINPTTNYYFGGFGNNYVDDLEVKRYRKYFSMPGFEIGEIAAREFGKVTVEFNLPPIRFSEVGQPSLFLKHIRSAIFVSGLITDPGEDPEPSLPNFPDLYGERTLTSIGFQLDLEFTFIHRLPMTLSVGYGVGYEDSDRNDDEWMVSLKIF